MTFLKHFVLVSGKQAPRLVLASLATALAAMLSACGGSAHITTSTASGPQLYMSPTVAGSAASGVSTANAQSATALLSTWSIDDTKKTFAQATYSFSDTQTGAQVKFSGGLDAPALQRGFMNLDLTYQCGAGTVYGCTGVSYNPSVSGGWALELADQAGGLAQIAGSPFAPLVAANSCPSMTTAETFQFITLPAPLVSTGIDNLGQWNPQLETAYGSVDISSSGTTVTLNNISQHVLPAYGGGAPGSPSATSVTGACSSTVYGHTVSVPAEVTIVNPGNGQTVTPQALFGIGPSGLLVENNGASSSNSPYYQNALGAGTGAIGLPKPASALDTTSMVAAQYLGFYYGSGTTSLNWSSAPVSFGFSSLPSSCASLAPTTSTMLYGGDFPNSNPTSSTTGYGNCDFAIDLGAQDASNNGRYPSATVYVGSGFGTNTTGKTYSFPAAVAIAGQLNGKYAIFLIGVDSTGSPHQAWGIYLLQSN
jgi:hypothetical protein